MNELAARVRGVRPHERSLVALDGVDGSGKTTFAVRLASLLSPRPVVTIHLDDFLHPSNIRHARGRDSAEGFWLDTYDYEAFEACVLRPLGPQGDGTYRTRSFDADADRVTTSPTLSAAPDSIVLVDGMFLHRDELLGRWDFSIFLDVPFDETARRMAERDGSHPDPNHPSMRRYVQGQRLYFSNAKPWERASVVIDNSDSVTPRLMPVGIPVGPNQRVSRSISHSD